MDNPPSCTAYFYLQARNVLFRLEQKIIRRRFAPSSGHVFEMLFLIWKFLFFNQTETYYEWYNGNKYGEKEEQNKKKYRLQNVLGTVYLQIDNVLKRKKKQLLPNLEEQFFKI